MMLQLIKSLMLSAMPPSTRARQTGRDDEQAAVATGNSREEGWLMQVVRILQLANSALMAEEAIVWAMGLVSISGQTPCRETEKIPKDVSSSIAHIKKLSDSNWHTWEPTFIDCLQRVHNAKEILYGIIAPGSEEYDKDLDKALVGLIHACCDNSPDSHIDTYTIRGADEEVQLGSMLYAKLKKALTLNDAVKLGKELDSIWNDAACLRKRFDKDLKKSTLYHCTAQDWFYANAIDALKTAKPDCEYDEAYHMLAKKQQDKNAAHCHGPGCSRSRRVTGSYGRSTGIKDLVEISREHGRSAVSMETMDSYGLTCKGGPSTAMRRTKLKEQAQPRRGPSSRSMQMVTTQGLERQEPKELSLIKGGGAVSKESTPGHEEEEQCRRS
ncbi:hypothetical protein NDA14_004152 [Ustilago hordei]|nr:hypothetical protein NDA14_004152 [Ustilago hordei]